MKPRPGRVWVVGAISVIGAFAALGAWQSRTADGRASDSRVSDAAAAFGLPPQAWPPDVVPDRQRIELGRKLFFDRRLSFNGTMSCAMCHVPEEAFTSNASRTAVGIEGRSLKRNAPSLLNVAWQAALFHDGRETSLSTQAWMPLLHADEMANPSIGHVLQRIRAMTDYEGRFERVFRGAGPSMETFGAAIAAFESTLVAADSAFDHWRYLGQSAALNEVEQRGFRIFSGKGGCTACHLVGERNAMFSDGRYHVTGAGLARPGGQTFVVPLAPGVQTVVTDEQLASFNVAMAPDLGRFEITLDPADRFAFKTPSLRNVARTAPYMHDGSLATLEMVIDFYDLGGGEVDGKSGMLTALGLDADEKRALAAFLRSLDGSNLAALAAGSRPTALP